VAAWVLVLTVKPHSPAEVKATVQRLVRESTAKVAAGKMKHKEKKAIDFVWEQFRYYQAFGLEQFKMKLTGATLKELEGHLLKHLGTRGVEVPDEPVLKVLKSKAMRALGELTPQAVQGAQAQRVHALKTSQLARARAAAVLAAAALKQKAPTARGAARLRNRERPTRVPPPPHNSDLVGKGIEFGFEFHQVYDLQVEAGGPHVGAELRREFDGEFFSGVVVRGSGTDDDLYAVRYADGDEETMTAAEVEELLTGETHAVGSTWATVRHLYGEIMEVATTRTRVGRSKKTTSKAMFFVRWDKGIYNDDDESATEWLEVLPKNHGIDGKDGWEIVAQRSEVESNESASDSEGEGSDGGSSAAEGGESQDGDSEESASESSDAESDASGSGAEES
jgi:hypothetical protein